MSQAGLAKIQDSNLPPDVPLFFEGNSGIGSASGYIFEILGTGGVSTSVVGNVMTITVATAAFTWNTVTAAMNPVTLVAENGYICKGAAPVNFILPAAATVGDTYKIIGYGNLWTIAQNAGQSITIGYTTSTIGVGGSVSASMISDALTLVNVTTNLEFFEDGIQGNVLIV